MDDPAQLSEYGNILLIIIVGILLVCLTMLLAKVISPNKPNAEKLSTYECGEEPTGSAWVQINPRFYVLALIFLLFDVELIFVFPWATVFGNADFIARDNRWGWFTLIEMAIFIGVLVVGLIYIWRRGDIAWIKPNVVSPAISVGIPTIAYDDLNRKKYNLQSFKIETVSEQGEKKQGFKQTESVPLGFRPKFKKSN